MKILLINKYHYLKGGAERAYFDTAKILENNGHDVAFFSMHHPENIPTEYEKYFIDEIRYDDGQSIYTKIKNAFKIFYNRPAARRLEKLIIDFKPDIAHLHNIYHQLSPSIIAVLKKHNIPVVMTLHDYKLISPNYHLLVRGEIWERSRPDKYYRCFFDRCVKDSYIKSLICTFESYLNRWSGIYESVDCFISPSRFLIEKFKEFGFKKNIAYLPNPLPEMPEKGDWPNDQIKNDYILFFGRLSREKGVDDLIKAFAKLENKIDLVIAGEGPEKNNLTKLVLSLAKINNVYFLGHKQSQELQNIVANAKLVVVPSCWYENAPYSVIEAMSLGRPVVCAKIGGLAELIKDGENGFLFKAGDISDLTRVIDKCLGQEANLTAISTKAKNSVETKNNPARYYSELLALYQTAIDTKKTA
jgi:glycosyltransferase involved in cell wall biosynthesis